MTVAWRGRLGYRWTSVQDMRLLSHYRNGTSMENISRLFNPPRGRSTIYRRLEILEEPAREPRKGVSRRGGYYAIVVHPEAHPLVSALLIKAREEWCNMARLSQEAGCCRETIHEWNRGGNPLLKNLEAAGKFLGLRLTWIEEEL